MDSDSLNHRLSVSAPMPISRATSSAEALSGGSMRATALSLNACPYLDTVVLHHRPRLWFYEGDNYCDAGGRLRGADALRALQGSSTGRQWNSARHTVEVPQALPTSVLRRAPRSAPYVPGVLAFPGCGTQAGACKTRASSTGSPAFRRVKPSFSRALTAQVDFR